MTEAKAILRNYHALVERQYKGDVDAICTLVDLADAIERANLTDRQTEALRYVYGDDLTQKVAGERMGISQPNVTAYIDTAVEKIDAIYEYIGWHNGDITKEDFNDEADTTINA